MRIIEFDEVSFKYQAGSLGEQIGLDQVELAFDKGRFTAIVGASGSGKSTLLQHLNGLLQPTSGRLQVLNVVMEAGNRVKRLNQLRKRVGLVFQFPEQQLFGDTVEEELMFGPLNFGASPEQALAQAEKAMDELGLNRSLLKAHPLELSGGQMRRVAIAAVYAAQPDVFVLDEPTASLDPASRIELLEWLHRCCKERGLSVFVVTHRLEEMLPYADGLLVMQDGKAIHHGAMQEWKKAEEALKAAGAALPPTFRLMRALAHELGIEPPDHIPSPKELAAWIHQRGAGRYA